MDFSISEACKCLGKKSLSEEALKNTTPRNGHAQGSNFHYKGIYRHAARRVYFSGFHVYQWVSFSLQKYMNWVSFPPKKYIEWVKFEKKNI